MRQKDVLLAYILCTAKAGVIYFLHFRFFSATKQHEQFKRLLKTF